MYGIDWLGPFVLSKDGTTLPLPIKKAQALLLLLARDGALPRERIVALLWPTLDESAARRNLRRELARLRDAGAAELIRADGDRLALDADVDMAARRFQAAVDSRQPEAALAMWRGRPADGLHLDDAEPWQEWLASERHRLQALYAQALALSAEHYETSGAWAQALERVRALLADDPLQERHHVHAMRLLDRLGQREAALAQFDACARLLADELGLQPMAATQQLAESLRGPVSAVIAPPSGAARPVPVDLLPALLPFVGRRKEMTWLESAWRNGQPILIEGEGGVGKTRLVGDFCAAHGPYALVPCRAGDAELPLASFTRSLRALAGPEPDVAALPAWAHDELARLMPELGAVSTPLRSEDERVRFVQACTLAWQHWAEGNFDAIVIDDWHLADSGSQALWMQVNSSCDKPQRLFIVYRPALTPAAAQLLLSHSQGGTARLRLEPLGADAVFELVQQLSRQTEPTRLATMLARATDGNPFYMAETLRHLVELGLLRAAADGAWRTPFDDGTAGDDELPLPSSVLDAVLGRVARLPDRARRVLEAAALADEPFGAELLAPACALSEVEAVLALEDALQARLLREADSGGLVFAHHLVQQALDSSLGDTRRRFVHRRLALGAIAANAPAAHVAAHHEAGGEPRRAVPWRRKAGDEAYRLHALADAIAQWRQALDDGPSPAEALELNVALMGALFAHGWRQESLAPTNEALRLAREGAGGPDQCIEAQIAAAAMCAKHHDHGDQALAILDALPALHQPHLRARALLVRSEVMLARDQTEPALAFAREALALEGLGAVERMQVLDSLMLVSAHTGRFKEALQFTEQRLALARSHGDRADLARALGRHGSMLTQCDNPDESEPVLREAITMTGQLGLVHFQRNFLVSLCVVHAAQTRPQAVLQDARDCWELRPPMRQGMQRVMVSLAFVEAHSALGELGEAHRWALSAIADVQAIGRLMGAAMVTVSTIELLSVLDDVQPLSALDVVFDPTTADGQLAPVVEARLFLGECQLMAGDVARARELRQLAGAPDQMENLRLRWRAVILDAALLLHDGNARGALAHLPAPDATGMNDELRLRALAVKLRAEAACGACDTATLTAADTALAHTGLHALAGLLLHQTLVQVADTPSRRRAWQQRVAALARTLQDTPDLRARFERRWLGAG